MGSSGAGTGGAATSPDGGSSSAPPLSPGGSAVAGGAMSPGAGSHASTPAASCCDTPRPIITDPVTGQTVCSCQYDNARLALSSYPRLSSAAVGVYGTPYPSTDQNPYPSIGVDSSAFYSPLVRILFQGPTIERVYRAVHQLSSNKTYRSRCENLHVFTSRDSPLDIHLYMFTFSIGRAL